MEDRGKLVDLELLVFRGAQVVEGSLFEGDVFTDEVDQPNILLVQVLN